MEYNVEEIQEICIAGIKTITDNTEGMTLIPQTWERFFSENILDRIENKIPESGIYAVYTEYESDENGKYAFVIGTRVTTPDLSVGISAVVIPAGKYAVFTAVSRDKVVDVWQHIWQSRIQRTYLSDFEYYDPTTEEIRIFVGIK